MYCTRCGIQHKENDRFCSGCGFGTAIRIEPETRARLMLSKSDKKIAGVCSGFARYLSVDVTLVRLLWLGIALCTGVGFVIYLLAWMMLPSDYGMDRREMFMRTQSA